MGDKWYRDETLLPFLREFINYMPQNPRILDLCCGAGYESMRMKKLGAEVVGFDFSGESIRIAKERKPHIKFDGCAVIAGLVHLPVEKLSRTFEQIANILNADGQGVCMEILYF